MRPRLLLALCCLTGCLSSGGGGTATTPDDESTGGETTAAPTTGGPSEPGTSTGQVDPDTTDPTSTGPGVCGDGVEDPGEACDNGPNNADDAPCLPDCSANACGDGFVLAGGEDCDDGNTANDDACVACEAARCGDGFVQKDVEVCDDEINDGSYGGCNADCLALGPHCGDELLDPEHEQCDDDGDACLASCELATSCLKIHTADAGVPSGIQTIYPQDPTSAVSVYCDMTSDGGGYTFLKYDVESDDNNLPIFASTAEAACAEFGMQLWIPRSPEHLLSGYAVATSENVFPQGGGSVAMNSDYLRILGIYPATPDMSCPGAALTPGDCPQWRASDSKTWYVTATSNSVTEPDPDGACKNCSMSYVWNGDGSVKTYKTVPNGASSFRFLCDTGDKLP